MWILKAGAETVAVSSLPFGALGFTVCKVSCSAQVALTK